MNVLDKALQEEEESYEPNQQPKPQNNNKLTLV